MDRVKTGIVVAVTAALTAGGAALLKTEDGHAVRPIAAHIFLSDDGQGVEVQSCVQVDKNPTVCKGKHVELNTKLGKLAADLTTETAQELWAK